MLTVDDVGEALEGAVITLSYPAKAVVYKYQETPRDAELCMLTAFNVSCAPMKEIDELRSRSLRFVISQYF